MTESSAGLALADRLLAAGIPVIVVGPNDLPRQRGWQRLTAEQCRLELFREGDALAMVAGHGIDVVDVDTKAGGSLDNLGVRFTSYGRTRTPSGGEHWVVPSTGLGKISPLDIPLIGPVGDYCGGRADGSGRLLVFLPGSVRSKYPDGGYVIEEPWDIEGCLAASPEPELINALRLAGGTSESPQPIPNGHRGTWEGPTDGPHWSIRPRIAAELRRLDQLQVRGWDGEPWDETCFKVACNLTDLADTPWSGYGLDQARDDFLEHAPTDENFGEHEHLTKWASAQKTTSGYGLTHHGQEVVPAEEEFKAEEPGPDRSSHADADLAARLELEHLSGVLQAWGKHGWALWDGRRWNTATAEDQALGIVRRALHEVIRLDMNRAIVQMKRRQAAGDTGAEKKLADTAAALKKLRSMAKIKSVAAALRTINNRTLVQYDGRATYDYLNCANGIVDLRTGQLLPHSRDFSFTKVSPVQYRPGATHADWAKALEAVPPSVRSWLQLRFGQAATGYPPSDDVVVFLKGGGANGKSTLLGAIDHALGDFALMASDKILTAGHGEHSTETFDLKGRRFVYVEELPDGSWVNANRLKKLSGTGQMTARPMRENDISWTPTHSLMITTNHDTQISDTDHATWRRLARVEFPYTFAEAARDAGLRARLKRGQAAEAVLAWIVEGAVKVHELGSEALEDQPERVVADTATWRHGANLPAQFFGDCFEAADKAAVPDSLITRMYLQWATENGHRGLSSQLFWKRLAEAEVFTSQRAERKAVRASSWSFPDGSTAQMKGIVRAVTGVQLSDPGEQLRNRMRDWS